MNIRPQDPGRDAEAVAALIGATTPLALATAEEWRHRRAAVPERVRLLAEAAEVGQRLVGAVEAGVTYFGPGDIGFVSLAVHPELRRQGIGAELYRLAIGHLRTLGVRRALALFDESEAGVSFARARGWIESRVEVWSTLDPRTVAGEPDPALRVVAARDLYPRELHRVDEEATRDLPSSEEVAAIPYDDWVAFVWNNPLFSRDGSFGAVADGRVAAISLVLADPGSRRAISMFTGTSPAYRGRGLAQAAKLASIRWAAEHGFTELATTNDERNGAMLAVNARLGYRPGPRRLEYSLEL